VIDVVVSSSIPAKYSLYMAARGLTPVPSFTKRVDERTILGEKRGECGPVVGALCGGELVVEGDGAVLG
jgi:hypothetical protein